MNKLTSRTHFFAEAVARNADFADRRLVRAAGLSAGNVSVDFRYSETDARLLRPLANMQESPEAIKHFDRVAKRLSSHGYWYTLGTLWVHYSGRSDLALWKQLFASSRQNRDTSVMKPEELKSFRNLPNVVTVYRAHRPGEGDWIAYTLDPQIAARFAKERGVREVTAYEVDRADILALFLRRGEKEVLVLDKTKVRLVRVVPVFLESPRLLTAFRFSQIAPADGEFRHLIHSDEGLSLLRLIRVAPGIALGPDTNVATLPADSQVSYLVTGGNPEVLRHPLNAPDEVRDPVLSSVLNYLMRSPEAVATLVRRETRLREARKDGGNHGQ